MSTKYDSNRIHCTNDYEKFSFYEANRVADHWPKIAHSIENRDLTPYNPIICALGKSGQLYIIDGQNRYLACKELGRPIYFVVVTDGQESDITCLNIYQKNWTIQDYLDFYTHKQKPEYLRVAKLLLDCPNLKLGYILRIWQGSRSKESSSESFRNGTYSLSEAGMRKCKNVSRLLKATTDNVDEDQTTNRSSIVAAFSSLLVAEQFDVSHMASQLVKYGYLFRKQGSAEQYAHLLETIYNYKQRSKISFRYAA